MNLVDALPLAQHVVKQLAPYCERIEIGGSIRRQMGWVKDIEIVCIPKREPIFDLFDTITGYHTSNGFVDTVNQWKRLKGEATGKYTQREMRLKYSPAKETPTNIEQFHPEGTINIDIFMAVPENWGVILMIRTGSLTFSKKMVGTYGPQSGYKFDDGFLWRGKTKIPVHDELALFKLFGMSYVPPEERY